MLIKRARDLIKKLIVKFSTAKLNVWLDDERPAPLGFLHYKTPEEVIEVLKTNRVQVISLDHDLGLEPDSRNGYMVARWIEEHAYLGELPRIECRIHSQNPAGRINMAAALKNADKFWTRRENLSSEEET
jgi:hypothetical protein